jgi:hypothetical protein
MLIAECSDIMTKYEIIIKGHLGSTWNSWFDDMDISSLPEGDTLISGRFKDQSHLHGILNKIRDLGIQLVKVEKKEK